LRLKEKDQLDGEELCLIRRHSRRNMLYDQETLGLLEVRTRKLLDRDAKATHPLEDGRIPATDYRPRKSDPTGERRYGAGPYRVVLLHRISFVTSPCGAMLVE
jgi:hypothetical protein